MGKTTGFRRGEKVYQESRIDLNKQPNGYIKDILWSDREILIHFHDGEETTFDWDDAYWSDKFGGIWFID